MLLDDWFNAKKADLAAERHGERREANDCRINTGLRVLCGSVSRFQGACAGDENDGRLLFCDSTVVKK